MANGGQPVLRNFPGFPLGQDFVNGQLTTIHVPVLPNYGNVVNNDSGLTRNNDKVLAMPGYYDWWPCNYEEMYDDDRNQATIHWMGPWSNRLAWKDWVLGYTTVVQNFVLSTNPSAAPVATASLSRIVPHQHPEMPWLFATDCKLVKGIGAMYNRDDLVVLSANGFPAVGPDGQIAFDPMIAYGEPSPPGAPWNDGKCVYAVTYRALDYDVLTDAQLLASPFAGSELGRYVTRVPNPSIRAIGIPAPSKGLFKFTAQAPAGIAGQVVTGAELPLLMPLFQLEYTWHEVPSVPWSILSNCVGRVNAVPFDPVGALFPHPAGTLLCQPAKAHRYRTKTGRICYRIVMRFDYQPQGWQNFPVALSPDSTGGSTYGFYPATFGGAVGGPPLYQTADFNQIFTVAT
jgi:hypothetical protein